MFATNLLIKVDMGRRGANTRRTHNAFAGWHMMNSLDAC